MNISAPINIPINKNKYKRQQKIAYYSSSSSSYSSYSDSPQFNIKKEKSVILRGAPFKNKETVKKLLILSVPSITYEDAERILEEVEKKQKATIIVCPENKASQYCSNLIENGLIVDLE